jgi:hypothetical protein
MNQDAPAVADFVVFSDPVFSFVRRFTTRQLNRSDGTRMMVVTMMTASISIVSWWNSSWRIHDEVVKRHAKSAIQAPT